MSEESAGQKPSKGLAGESRIERARKRIRKNDSRIPLIIGVGGGVMFVLILVAFAMGGIFEWDDKPEEVVSVFEKYPELVEAEGLYNEAFKLMGRGEYDGALPVIVKARERFGGLMEVHPGIPWVEDCFRRLNTWERELRDYEFQEEARVFRSNGTIQ